MISPDIHILTDADLNQKINAAFQRGVARGLFDDRACPSLRAALWVLWKALGLKLCAISFHWYVEIFDEDCWAAKCTRCGRITSESCR